MAGVACHVGVAWGSVVAEALRVTLKGRGGSAGSYASACRDGSAGSCAPRWGDVAGRRWQGVGVAGEREKKKKKPYLIHWAEGLACRVGAARRVGGGDTLGRGQMEVASVHQRGAMTCNVQVRHVLITSEDGRGAWKGESGEAGRGVEVGAQAGGLRPLPPPCAREPPPFVPTPTRRSDMARNTPPPPTR
ncbi:hypothetical protein EDB89DRAFT_1900781 [Lactarius sanguifluus]|nr:hypothetical protein EDB89DRAFT_1900781 [Lactarius sanguifluus]